MTDAGRRVSHLVDQGIDHRQAGLQFGVEPDEYLSPLHINKAQRVEGWRELISQTATFRRPVPSIVDDQNLVVGQPPFEVPPVEVAKFLLEQRRLAGYHG